MALVYRAVIRPTKLELLNPWVAAQSWYSGPPRPDLQRLGAYRFDDPAGEVGVETLLIREGDGPLFQVPVTYRAAPLDGAERFLIGTMEHSVLGSRWIYDACGDPVYAAALLATMLTGGTEAPEFVDFDGEPRQRQTLTNVRGSGSPSTVVPTVKTVTGTGEGDPTVIATDAGDLAVLRVLGKPAGDPAAATLTGTWAGQESAVLLASAV
jgi:hypothetical protein